MTSKYIHKSLIPTTLIGKHSLRHKSPYHL